MRTDRQSTSTWRRAVPILAAVVASALFAGCAPEVSTGAIDAGARCSTLGSDAPTVAEQSTIFLGGDGSAPVYRIPSIVTTGSGVLVAFAEARPSLADPGSGLIKLVGRRSLDCGRTWSAVQVLADNSPGDSHNPTAVVAPGPDGSETIFLFYGQRPASPGGEFDLDSGFGPRTATMWLRTSTDDGATWSAPRNLTAGLKDPTWRVASFGPGQGIVTQWNSTSATAGRIVVPGWYSVEENGERDGGTFVVFSDDGGQTWTRRNVSGPGTGEPQLVELNDGSLLFDARSGPTRALFRSEDGGETWSGRSEGLAMAPITAGVIRHRAVRDGDPFDRLIHSGIAPDGRYDARVWTSADEGRTWGPPTVLVPGFNQYTLLTPLPDGTVGLVNETACLCGDFWSNRLGFAIRFHRFDPDRIDPR